MDAPPIQYARTEDGVNIAYAVAGDGPPVLVCILPFSHVQALPGGFFTGAAIPALAGHMQTAWLDGRGTGMSDRDVVDGSFNTRTADIEAVANALNWDRFAIYSSGIGCIPVVRFAARHPERVTKLVLVIPFARGADFIAQSTGPAASGLANIDMSVLAEAIIRSGGPVDDEVVEHFVDLVPRSISADQYLAMLDEVGRTDISGDLVDLQCPTLVIAMDRMRNVPSALSRTVAANIPDSRLMLLTSPHSDNQQHINASVNFLRGEADAATTQIPAGSFRTILFTDVVASTPLLAQLKDAKMREVMQDHDAVLDAAVTEHGGRVVKEIGDAFMVEFAIPSAAVECAIAMQQGIQAQFTDSDVPIRLRIGINAGEPVEEDGDLHGASVVIAKRLESAAETNGILVSDVVKQMVMGKDFEFADQGEVALKGFDEPVHAWSVEWS